MVPSGGDWDRWRGRADERHETYEEDLDMLKLFKDDVSKRIAILKTKMVVFAALAAGIGAMLPGVVQAVVKQLGGP